MTDYIQFINHASVKINISNKLILCDPWYEGSIFNNGWDLIASDEIDYKDLINDLDYIWISHEHPDHFSVKFFIDNENIIKESKLTILFQTTKDKRVINFLKKKGFKVIEIVNNLKVKLAKNLDIAIYKNDFYDSGLLLFGKQNTIFNINDHHLNTSKDIEELKKKYGTPNVLLTQFSYAAWKGNVEETKIRMKAAMEKINSINMQIEILKPKYVMPFASFVYFSNVENFYMNDAYNTPAKVINNVNSNDSKILFFKPLEKWEIGSNHNSNESIAFWTDKFNDINEETLNNYKTVDQSTLEENFYKYVSRIKSKNNLQLMRLASIFPFLNAFKPFVIYLHDLDKYIEFSIFKPIKFSNKKLSYHIKMHSNSLDFIFKNEFGFDTLLVNACFESNFDNFVLVSKTFSIGSLNAMGVFINFKAILDYKVFLRFIYKLFRARKKFELAS